VVSWLYLQREEKDRQLTTFKANAIRTIGIGLCFLTVVAFLIGGGVFAANGPLPVWLNQLGFACFVGWPGPAGLGIIFIIWACKAEHKSDPYR
jgi:hypothetical protein